MASMALQVHEKERKGMHDQKNKEIGETSPGLEWTLHFRCKR
jgi:hypothetical protein